MSVKKLKKKPTHPATSSTIRIENNLFCCLESLNSIQPTSEREVATTVNTNAPTSV